MVTELFIFNKQRYVNEADYLERRCATTFWSIFSQRPHFFIRIHFPALLKPPRQHRRGMRPILNHPVYTLLEKRIATKFVLTNN